MAGVEPLYVDYASAVDSDQWGLRPEFFTHDCVYRHQPRKIHECGFLLATLSFTSKGMLRDRVYGIKETLFHEPYCRRHIVGTPVVRRIEEDRSECEANHAMVRTKLSEANTVFSVGRNIDTVVKTPLSLKFARRECIYDSKMVSNSIIYPI